MERVILLVEDDDVDGESLVRALAKQQDAPEVVWKRTAEEAFAWVQNRGEVEVLALVDINLPGMSGHEFVERWKAREAAVVWFLSSSGTQEDIDRAYEGCAAGYFVKAAEAHVVDRMAATLCDFIHGVQLPTPGAGGDTLPTKSGA